MESPHSAREPNTEHSSLTAVAPRPASGCARPAALRDGPPTHPVGPAVLRAGRRLRSFTRPEERRSGGAEERRSGGDAPRGLLGGCGPLQGNFRLSYPWSSRETERRGNLGSARVLGDRAGRAGFGCYLAFRGRRSRRPSQSQATPCRSSQSERPGAFKPLRGPRPRLAPLGFFC